MTADLWARIDRTCLHSSREKGLYGSWSSSYVNILSGVGIEKNYGHRKVAVDFDVQIGDVVFVLWAEWSTGDSFGKSKCGSADVIHIFKNPKLALAAKDKLKDESTDPTVEFETDSGQLLKCYRPWCDYFDNLEEVNVAAVLIQG